MVELLLELVGATIYGFFGALVGILYPPKSPAWALAQKYGLGLLCATIIAWAVAYTAAIMLASRTAAWTFTALGTGCFIAYLAVGNTCRRFHEKDEHDDADKA
jgi:hypothetical protein